MLPHGVVAGLIYITEVSIIVPLHIVVIVILLRGQEFRNLTAYRIMTHMSICECVQMMGYLTGNVMSICQTTFHPYVARVDPGLKKWINSMPFRFLVFVDFKMTAAGEKKFCTIVLVVVWTLSVMDFAIHMTPELSMVYIVERNTFWFADNPLAALSGRIEYYYAAVTLFCTLVVCVATVITIVVKRNQFSTQFKIAAGEVKIFAQSFIIFLYLSLVRCAWAYIAPYLRGEASFVALGIASQAVGGLNPLIYCTMNKAIRQHLLRMLGCKSYITTTVTSIHTK
uniref:7TM_GPCR_Srx domain-containing protein n=1 Tax=Steinernema glaseri TaxID=37863 RepID=A0A1I7Y5R5_9BILA